MVMLRAYSRWPLTPCALLAQLATCTAIFVKLLQRLALRVCLRRTQRSGQSGLVAIRWWCSWAMFWTAVTMR